MWKPERGFRVAGLLPLDRACRVSRALIYACSETFMLFTGLGGLTLSGPNSCRGLGVESGKLGGWGDPVCGLYYCSVAKSCLTFVDPLTPVHQVFTSLTIFQSLLKLISFESVMSSNHLIFCVPPLLLPSVFSSIRIFSIELALPIKWPKDWSFSINPSSTY